VLSRPHLTNLSGRWTVSRRGGRTEEFHSRPFPEFHVQGLIAVAAEAIGGAGAAAQAAVAKAAPQLHASHDGAVSMTMGGVSDRESTSLGPGGQCACS
jgi:hypothetical protein